MTTHLRSVLLTLTFCLPILVPVHGQVPASATPVQSEWNRGATVFRHENRVWIQPDQLAEAGSLHIPRFCASIRALEWVGEKSDLLLVPEPAHWVVSWKKASATARTILITFDSDALLPAELKPVQPAGDGSITLHAFLATTRGEKLRFEPQPHKNTVGYWTIASDSATWKFEAASAGSYSVGLLQGCGAGQGGSQARVEISSGGQVIASKDFETVDTGHFQNFRWLHLGHLELAQAGSYELAIRPTRIAKGALFDVRTIHLVKQAKAAR
jgi:hypothetical protein